MFICSLFSTLTFKNCFGQLKELNWIELNVKMALSVPCGNEDLRLPYTEHESISRTYGHYNGGGGGEGGGGILIILKEITKLNFPPPFDGKTVTQNHFFGNWERSSFMRVSINGHISRSHFIYNFASFLLVK